MMPTAAEPIEVEYRDETPYTPSVAPPAGLTRADVLTQARVLAAECSGVAALVEGALGTARPAFVDAWRRWYGSWLGRHLALERFPFEAPVADAEVRRWQDRLRAWRAGLACELSAAAPPASAQSAAAPAPVEKKGWPTWAKLLGLGGGAVLLYKVGQWIFTPSYTSTAQVVNDVVETTDAVNAVRKRN